MNGERTGKCLRQVVNIYTQYMKTFSPCPRPGPGLSYVVVFCVFNDLRRDVFVRFVDIGGVMDYYRLSFLFANIYALKALDAHRNMLCIVICNSWVLQYRERISIDICQNSWQLWNFIVLIFRQFIFFDLTQIKMQTINSIILHKLLNIQLKKIFKRIIWKYRFTTIDIVPNSITTFYININDW